MNLTALGIIAGIFTSSSSIPQLVKILKEKKVEDLSPLMFITLTIGVALWIYYGIRREDLPIIITNAFSLLVNLIIVILHFKYKRN